MKRKDDIIMKATFERLKKISSNYRAAVDELAEEYELDGRRDYLYNDEIKNQRVQERNADYNAKIDVLAKKAQETAGPEIVKLRETIQTYITNSTDPATVQTLQALLAAGVELSSAEIEAFVKKGGYAILRLLEGPGKGHIKAPDPMRFEQELKDLATHFEDISTYRGGLAKISPDKPWGLVPVTGNVIMAGRLDKFPAKLDAMAERWACIAAKTGDNQKRE